MESFYLKAVRSSDGSFTTSVSLALGKTSQIWKGGESLEEVWVVLSLSPLQLLPPANAALLDRDFAVFVYLPQWHLQ